MGGGEGGGEGEGEGEGKGSNKSLPYFCSTTKKGARAPSYTIAEKKMRRGGARN
jgi:hypothetical protein